MRASSFKVVVPARYASTRLPGKPLLDLGGKPMVIRVAEQAKKSGASEVVVATDHPEIFRIVQQHGFSAIMTSTDHPTGTDRLAEVVSLRGWQDEDIVVNVQGDEPLIDPALISLTAECLGGDNAADIATVGHPITSAEDFFNPNVVKVVCQRNGDAVYFSRAPIPFARDHFAADKTTLPKSFPAYRHVGMYAYKAGFLKAYKGLSIAPTETFESLEQLRALWHGYRITLLQVDHAPAPGVDTPEDYERVRKLFDQGVDSR